MSLLERLFRPPGLDMWAVRYPSVLFGTRYTGPYGSREEAAQAAGRGGHVIRIEPDTRSAA